MSTRHEISAGLSISLTGKYARQGRQALDGLRLWQAHARTEGPVGPLRLIWYDDESRVTPARENTLRLIQQDRVDLLFGPYSSALTLAAAEVSERHNRILWNHGGASDEIFRRGYRRLVSVLSPASDYLRGVPAWLARNFPAVRRISILHATKGTFAAHVTRGIVEAAQPVGVHSVELFPIDSPPGGVPQTLVLVGSFEEEIRILRTPLPAQAVVAVAAGVNAFHQELQQAAEGVIGPSQWEPGPESKWFVREFRRHFGSGPEYTAAGSFAMGLVVEECIRRAGSLDEERLREIAGQLDLDTFYGRFRISPGTGCQIGHRVRLVRWKQGRKVTIA